MAAEASALLKGLDVTDLRLDRFGRVVITNDEIARRVRDAQPDLPSLLDEVAGNGICCGNGSCLSSELVGLFERVVGGRAAR